MLVWKWIWTAVLVGGICAFVVLAITVAIGGYVELKKLLNDKTN